MFYYKYSDFAYIYKILPKWRTPILKMSKIKSAFSQSVHFTEHFTDAIVNLKIYAHFVSTIKLSHFLRTFPFCTINTVFLQYFYALQHNCALEFFAKILFLRISFYDHSAYLQIFTRYRQLNSLLLYLYIHIYTNRS